MTNDKWQLTIDISIFALVTLVFVTLERWLSGRKRQIANLLERFGVPEGSNPSLSVFSN
jgi:hypothetical protein